MVKEIYDSMWKDSKSAFDRGDFSLDENLRDRSLDDRMGITILAKPSFEIVGRISEFLNRLKTIEPGQHYYSAQEIHVTVLSVISCRPGFDLSEIDTNAYEEIIGKVVGRSKAFEIDFRGVTASKSCVLVQGFPVGDGLEKMRDELRRAFAESKLETTIDLRYRLKTAHCTVVRFKEPLSDGEAFVDLLESHREHDFGKSEIHSIELVYNDWYMSESAAKLAEFEFGRR